MNYCIEITTAQGRANALSKQIEAREKQGMLRGAMLQAELRQLYARRDRMP